MLHTQVHHPPGSWLCTEYGRKSRAVVLHRMFSHSRTRCRESVLPPLNCCGAFGSGTLPNSKHELLSHTTAWVKSVDFMVNERSRTQGNVLQDSIYGTFQRGLVMGCHPGGGIRDPSGVWKCSLPLPGWWLHSCLQMKTKSMSYAIKRIFS